MYSFFVFFFFKYYNKSQRKNFSIKIFRDVKNFLSILNVFLLQLEVLLTRIYRIYRIFFFNEYMYNILF